MRSCWGCWGTDEHQGGGRKGSMAFGDIGSGLSPSPGGKSHASEAGAFLFAPEARPGPVGGGEPEEDSESDDGGLGAECEALLAAVDRRDADAVSSSLAGAACGEPSSLV